MKNKNEDLIWEKCIKHPGIEESFQLNTKDCGFIRNPINIRGFSVQYGDAIRGYANMGTSDIACIILVKKNTPSGEIIMNMV